MLATRQLAIALVDAPALAHDVRNPRSQQRADHRGAILARDGTPLALTRNGRRIYPQGRLTAHVVGYASTRYGTSGLEDAFDRVLRAPEAADSAFEELASLVVPQPSDGATVITTIDVDVQRALVAALRTRDRAAAVALDPRTGAVLALAAQPDFDPNTLDAAWPRLRADPQSPLLDRSTRGLYPPGSTFKIVTAADALDAGIVTMQSRFVDTGGLRVGSFTVRNDNDEVTGTQDLAGAFALSSNVDFAAINLQLGRDRWYDYAHRWRLGEAVDFDLPTERDQLPAPATVSDSILAQLGFGQASLLVTPLRMALVGATIANGGNTPRPFVVRSIAGRDTHLATRAETIATPISAAAAADVRALMVAVVTRGTGRSAALPGVTVAGKTGTATNPHGPAHSWFVAFAPAEAPRVVVAVVVENAGYGAAIAAPIARDVVRVALLKTRT